MLHPSYTDLMQVVNSNVEIGEEPVINSRYSIVIATAKRARQLIDRNRPLEGKKPFSVAVDELYKGKIQILPEGYEPPQMQEVEQEVPMDFSTSDMVDEMQDLVLVEESED